MSVSYTASPTKKMGSDDTYLFEKQCDVSITPEYKSLLREFSHVKELDVALGLSRIPGMIDLYGSTLQLLAETLPDCVQRLQIFLADHDLARFSIEVHGLKGSFAGIGAMGLCGDARLLEAAAKANYQDFCFAHIDDFVKRVVSFSNTLSDIFSHAQKKSSRAKQRRHQSHLFPVLPSLYNAIDDFEINAAFALLEELTTYTYSKSLDQLLEEAYKSLRSYDYEKCLQILNKIERG